LFATQGILQAFFSLGLFFLVWLVLLSLLLKFPPLGWKPAGWQPAAGAGGTVSGIARYHHRLDSGEATPQKSNGIHSIGMGAKCTAASRLPHAAAVFLSSGGS
jgi:hypothetical protein